MIASTVPFQILLFISSVLGRCPTFLSPVRFPFFQTIDKVNSCSDVRSLTHVGSRSLPVVLSMNGSTVFLQMQLSKDDSEERAEKLPLSVDDIQRLENMRKMFKIIPIMIMDAMLPGQRLEFGSVDKRFRKLVDYALKQEEQSGTGIIGMIGFNPYTGRPLSSGVTLSINPANVKLNNTSESEVMVSISVQGDRRFEVRGEPWMDESKSFYLADIEFVDCREEEIGVEEMKRTHELSKVIPDMVDKWVELVIEKGKSDQTGMDMRMKDIGPMPDEPGKRAIWVGALINPLPALGVCLEIRPAMLACKNDFDRIKLAVSSIQSSIDHLSGKEKLF